MNSGETSENTSRTNRKLDDFKRKHSDMEAELKRRLLMLKMKNIRSFLKQID